MSFRVLRDPNWALTHSCGILVCVPAANIHVDIVSGAYKQSSLKMIEGEHGIKPRVNGREGAAMTITVTQSFRFTTCVREVSISAPKPWSLDRRRRQSRARTDHGGGRPPRRLTREI